jgi:hypothetical protein
MACLDTAIGLSRTVCNCYEDTPPDYDVSDSGYYIDEAEGFNLSMAGASEDCEQGSIWDILVKARENAIKDLKGDLLTQMGANYKKTLETNSYTIGSQKYETSGPYNPGTTYAGVRLVPRQIHNGVIKLNSVKLLFNTTGVIQCRIFNNLSSTPIQSFTVNCVANTASASSALNYSLPMYVSGEQIEYYLVYELPGTGLPLQNKIVCSSCLKWEMKCCDTPCFGNRIVRDQMWHNNLMIGAIKGDTWEDLDGQTGLGNQMNGFILNITTACDYEEIICQNLDYGLGSLPTANGMVIAKALQVKSAAYVISSLLTSQNISRLNMSNREEIGYLRSKYMKEYNDKILWLANNMDVSQNGCFYCEPRINKVGILA